jgi:hypothetical protein
MWMYIILFEGRDFSPNDFFETLKYEIDQLYAEGATCRRLMSISKHGRIGGTALMISALN